MLKSVMDKYKVWKFFYRKNLYYHSYVTKILTHMISKRASVIEFGAKGGEILLGLKNKKKLGVNFPRDFPTNVKGLKLINFEDIGRVDKSFDYIVLNHALSEVGDIQNFITKAKKLMHEDSVVIVLSFNYFWKGVFDIAARLNLKYPFPANPNWLEEADIKTLFNLEGMKRVSTEKHMLIPFYIPWVSNFINKYLSQIPLINNLCVTQVMVFRSATKRPESAVSIVIPAKNEQGNIKNLLAKIPHLGKWTEVIFIEGHSNDETLTSIKQEITNYYGPIRSSYYTQTGVGKADAVRLGFKKAKGDILMILDADLTVRPGELTKFYQALTQGAGELVMGSRLIYPMEGDAMPTINFIGNKMFSVIFSFLLNQRIKDTLCGTKVLYKKHYEKIREQQGFFGNFDPFGDFDLIFGAKKTNLKILEIPVRYRARRYGSTNISRFSHGWLLIKMAYVAARKLKFIN